ncbi:MAG: hypothetical protein FWH55_01285 [Oscillospiraceae bacterium]|nr:hypothetical protein [Oscillospiraceae bacterium]
MTSKERVFNTLNRKSIDRIALFDYLFQKDIYEYSIGKSPSTYNSADIACACHALSIDIAAITTGSAKGVEPEWIDSNTYIDEWRTTRRVDPASWPTDAPIAFPISCRKDYNQYVWPDPTIDSRYEEIDIGIEYCNKFSIVAAGSVLGPLSLAWLLVGPEELFIMMYEDPELVEDIFKRSNEYFIESAKRQIDAGVDIIFVAEDLGHNTGGFVSNKMFRDLILPYLNELIEWIQIPVFLHSCGNINEYLDDLTEMNFSAIHPLQRSAGMDIGKAFEKYGDKMCFIGNVDSSVELPLGTEEDVRRQTRECIDAAKNNRLILASDHSLHDGIPVRNILAMLDEAKKYGRQCQELKICQK